MAKSAEYDLGEYAYPRGWFVVAESQEVRTAPFNVHYFGQDIVLFRGESGNVVMLEANCPHMGTHFGTSRTGYIALSRSSIEGDSIRCPFHGWRFGADGKCNDIPYFDGPIPDKACVKSWPTVERYGVIFCWNDPEGQEADFSLPSYPEWDDEQWVRWEGLDHIGDLPCHPIEIVDNNSDVAHLHYVHGSEIVFFENEVDGPHLYMRQRGRSLWGATPAGEEAEASRPTLTTLNCYVGPGILKTHYFEARATKLMANTPIDDGSTRLWQCTMKQSAKPTADAVDAAEARAFNKSICDGLLQDAEIWSTKNASLNIMQILTDGPLKQSRAWYSQFYNPRRDTAEILAKCEGKYRIKGKPGAPEALADVRDFVTSCWLDVRV
jgi:3-ketosteroid 9alpha-monooxygenase subunit A